MGDTIPQQVTHTVLLSPWLIMVSVLLTMLLTFLRIRDALKYGTLDAKLTKEVFFRITNMGEGIFCNVVLLVRHGPVEIRSIKFELNKTTGSKKTFVAEPIWIGEKKPHTDGVIANHHFSTQSPVDFIPTDTAKRILYCSVLNDYSEKIEKCFSNLRAKAFRVKTEVEAATQMLPSPEKDQQIERIRQDITTFQRHFLSEVMQNIQVEGGSYELSFTAEYKGLGFFSRSKKSVSKICFDIEDIAKQWLQFKLGAYVDSESQAIIFNKNLAPPYPEYKPVHIRELD